ncbi:MAG: hypothetical protein R3277_10790 [Brumimicrobium sp.]|nr:hypothetical protein [Brumimicrobium sp.]
MKRISALLLLLVVSIPFWGSYGWLKYEKYTLKKSLKKELSLISEEEHFVHFTFNLKDTAAHLKWEHSKEFEYRGEMYDIVSRKYSGDSVTYKLWWDQRETTLNRRLAELVDLKFSNFPFKSEKSSFLHWVNLNFIDNSSIPVPVLIQNTEIAENITGEKVDFYAYLFPPDIFSPPKTRCLS